jgi:hypothetical protein
MAFPAISLAMDINWTIAMLFAWHYLTDTKNIDM